MTTILLHEYVEQVEKLIDDNRLVEAIEHCRHILHSYPRHIATYRVMGKAMLEKKEYAAANDLFLRILGADPNDFISHVGLSIIYKEESQYDQALWHLERAFEIQPYNVAIQGEMRKLYDGQSETRPGIIPLTRGALARLYMQGELYQQAISELRRVLKEEPSRVDLQVLLAEALWRDDRRIDAEEMCLTVLEELPNCIVLNAILAEIWLQTGRIPEAQKYLYRLHSLTQQTQKFLDKETIAGQAFAIKGAFPLPEQASLEFLQTGTVIPEAPSEPTADWVGEVSFDDVSDDTGSLDQVVLEPESGMHSYDWLADIEELDDAEKANEAPSETDWFSEDKSKEALNLATGELSAEWLADLRGDEADAGFQPLDLEGIVDEPVVDEAADETDWFSASDEIADGEIAAPAEDKEDTAVTVHDEEDLETGQSALPDWLDDLSDDDAPIEIAATSLMDDNLSDWADSESHIVEEPKTPYWLSELADKELDAVQLNPEDALDWMSEPEEAVPAVDDDVTEGDDPEFTTTAVLDDDELEELDADAPELETGSLGEAEDWLSALTEGSIDEEISWEADPPDDAAALSSDLVVEATTDELAALSDADDWLQAAAADLDAILEAEESEEEEFPNLAIPELEGDDITDIPDWLDNEYLDLSEESEAAVSSENDPQETPQPVEPEVEPTQASENDDAVPDALDWLDDLTSDSEDNKRTALPDPPVETEGMPSWLSDIPDDTAVEIVDEWDSASADIPDWLQEPVALADLDEDDALIDDNTGADVPGLTGLLSEMDVDDEALPLDQMDSLIADWMDEDAEGSLTDLLSGAQADDESPSVASEPAEEMVEDGPVVTEETSEIGLTGLLSNLTMGDAEPAETGDDFLSDFLDDSDSDDDLSGFLLDDAVEAEAEPDDALGLNELDLEGVSLTEMLSDIAPEEEMASAMSATPDDEGDDDWLSSLAELTDADGEAEPEAEEEIGLTGMLANLWPDEEADEVLTTAVADADDSLQSLVDQPDEEVGLTELLAGIDYEEDIHESEIRLEEFDIEPVEPSLTAVLSEMDVAPEPTSEQEPEEEATPISAEDTTWLNQLEADTGALQEQADDFDLAEETGLDWLTAPDEPEAEIEEVEPQEIVAEDAEEHVVVEQDSAPEDWDDAMSWLEELAAQQDEPVEELPSVAETMLDEELDTAAELAATTPMESSNMDWLDDLTDGEEAGSELESALAIEADDDQPDQPESAAETAEEPAIELDDLPALDDLVDEDEVSWLDELGTDMLEESAVEELETVPETAVDEAESVGLPEAEDTAWLDELAMDDASLDDAFDDILADEPPDLDLLTDVLHEMDEPEALPVSEMTDDAEDLGWLDEVMEASIEEETELASDETDLVMADEAADDDEALTTDDLIVTGVTDALKEDSGIEEAEADLEEALAWLDELDEEDSVELGEVELFEEAPPTRVNLADESEIDDEPTPVDEMDSVEEPETVVVAPETDALTLALNRLAAQVLDEGVDVPETAVFPISLSSEELNAALDWIEETEAAPAVEEDVAESEPEALVVETAVADEDEFDLDEMSDDPEAWLEQLLSNDVEMEVETELPPIKPSEDAMFVTDDAAVLSEEDVAEPERAEDIVAEIISDETVEMDSLLDDVALDGMPDDPDAAVAWLDELVDGEDTARADDIPPSDTAELEADLASMEDDPEAWLEQMLSGDLAMDVEMEPPPIKPSEDAMFVTDDAEPALAAEPDIAEAALDSEDEVDEVEAVDAVEAASAEDDPEAWLEQMLSGDLEMDVEMEPPPIKPSEDAMFVTDDGRSDELTSEDDADEMADSEPASLAEESDIIGEVPDDPDEAMVWLEQLAARQGAAMDELPTVTDAEAEPEMPTWMVDELEELAAEPDLELADEGDSDATAVSAVPTVAGTEPDEDIDAELPEWLGEGDDDQIVGETDWLRALPEVDMETWLSAEEEATLAGPTEEVVIPDTGPLKAPPEGLPQTDLDDDLYEPVPEPSTGAYSVDEAQLGAAQAALADGRLAEAITQFKELVASGSGMMTIIAELEQAAENHPQTPALSQVLGDAYMRNGQLQKALTSYRAALDQM